MFDPLNGTMDQFQMIQSLMQDENFKAFISHSKVQELFRDPDFREVAKDRDFSRILSHPKFTELMRDPELSRLMASVDFKKFMNR